MVEVQKSILFGILSSGVSNKRNQSKYKNMCQSVNASGLEACTTAEKKKEKSGWKKQIIKRQLIYLKVQDPQDPSISIYCQRYIRPQINRRESHGTKMYMDSLAMPSLTRHPSYVPDTWQCLPVTPIPSEGPCAQASPRHLPTPLSPTDTC